MKFVKTPKKKEKKSVNLTSNFKNEFKGIVLFSVGILTALSLYSVDSVGVIGNYLRGLLLGLVGTSAFFIPVMIVVYSFCVVFKYDNEIFLKKFKHTIFLMIIFSALLQLGQIYNDKTKFENLTFTDAMIESYKMSGQEVVLSGGLVGGFISYQLSAFLHFFGTLVVLSAVAVIDIILLTNISIAELLNKLKDKSKLIAKNNLEKIKASGQSMPNSGNRSQKAKTDFTIIGIDDKSSSKKNAIPSIDNQINLSESIKNDQKSGKKSDGKNVAIKEKISKLLKKEKTPDKDDKEVDRELKKSVNKDEKFIKHDEIDYKHPKTSLLNEMKKDMKNAKELKDSVTERAEKLIATLKSFKIDAEVKNVSCGPAVTRYEIQPSAGVKVSRIVGLADDISMNLASHGVRIEAPIPGKAAIGIEVPNKDVTAVFLKEVLESDEFKDFRSRLAFGLGKDISGKCIVADIGKMPHVLIAGATGSGKSVCINSLIISLLYKASPKDVKLIMIDPKVVELGVYNGIPHLLIPVVTDPKKAAGALHWAVQEMTIRYKKFAENGVRDLHGYNALMEEKDNQDTIPQIVIIIDELADLMMVAPNEVEDSICRLAQMARAAGMHLVIATQRPSVDVITGIIKANIPSRISFAVASQIDSRTILDMMGAEKLLGKGDMLYYPVGEPKPIRIKGAFITDKEVEKVVKEIKKSMQPEYNEEVIDEINKDNMEQSSKGNGNENNNDELLPRAVELIIENGQASASFIQRKLKVGYARAARIIDQMEERKIVSEQDGSKARQVLMTKHQWAELLMTDGKSKDVEI